MLSSPGVNWLAVPVLTLVALVTARGSGGGSTGGGGGNPPQAAAGGGGDFCQIIKDQLSGLEKVFPKDFSDAGQLKAYGTYLEETNTKILAAAPSEIRADVETEVKASNASAAYYKTGVKPPTSANTQLRSPEFKAATQKVSAYTKDKCGIGPSVAPTS